MKLNVYVGMRKTLNKNKKKIILEMKTNKQTNKQTKTQEFKSLFEWELDLKSSNILWFYFTNHIIHTRLNVLKPYDNYVAM